MGFKDFENRVKDVKVKLTEDHSEAVKQSITPVDESSETMPDSK